MGFIDRSIESRVSTGAAVESAGHRDQDPLPDRLSSLEARANAGDEESQLWLALLSWDGVDVPLDRKKALHWLSVLAERGNVIAHFQLGEVYEEGIDTCRDLDLARRHYRAAERAGHMEARSRRIRLDAARGVRRFVKTVVQAPRLLRLIK